MPADRAIVEALGSTRQIGKRDDFEVAASALPA